MSKKILLFMAILCQLTEGSSFISSVKSGLSSVTSAFSQKSNKFEGISDEVYQIDEVDNKYTIIRKTSIDGMVSAILKRPKGEEVNINRVDGPMFWWDQAKPLPPDPKRPKFIEEVLKLIKPKYNNKPRFLFIMADVVNARGKLIVKYYVMSSENEKIIDDKKKTKVDISREEQAKNICTALRTALTLGGDRAGVEGHGIYSALIYRQDKYLQEALGKGYVSISQEFLQLKEDGYFGDTLKSIRPKPGLFGIEIDLLDQINELCISYN